MPKLAFNAPSTPGQHSEQPRPVGGGWGQAADTGHSLPLSYYLAWGKRYRGRVLTFVLVVTVVAALVSLALPKQYDAVAVLRVDPVGQRVVGDTTQTSVGQSDSTLLVTTESRIIASPAVVAATISALHLEGEPEFKQPAAELAGMSPAERLNNLIRTVTKRISVLQPVQTYLMEVHFTAHDPALAAAVANGLANAFLDHEYSTRAKALTDSTRYMADKLDSLRAQEEQDQTALVSYESTHDVIDPDDKANIYNARLNQFNADLSQAASARMRLQADDAIARSGDLDALRVSDRGQSLAPLQDHLRVEQQKLDQMSAIYGVNHPLYLQQERVVAQAQRALNDEAAHITRQVDAEYQEATLRERLIQSGLNREKSAMDAFNLRAIKYHALKAQSDSSTALYYDLQRQIADSTVAAGLRSEDLRLIGPARVPDKPSSPKPGLITLLAALVATLAAAGIVVALSLRDRTISSPDQVEALYGAAVLGGLPAVPSKDVVGALKIAALESDRREGAGGNNYSPFQEAVLSLHTNLQLLDIESASCIALTSSVPGEGKSTTVAHLAQAFAALGSRIVLVDSDLRKPSVHRRFGVSNQAGLSTVFTGEADLDQALVASGQPGLTLLPAGPLVGAPSELFHRGLATVIERLRGRFDRILIDCPPLLGFAEPALIASHCDGVLLLVRAESTDQAQVGASVRALRAVRANLLGIILNRVSSGSNSYYTYYNSNYYAAYNGDTDEFDE